ncbi:MAG: hypothetical protein ACJ0RV_03245 [Longimicrobiales bacterium]
MSLKFRALTDKEKRRRCIFYQSVGMPEEAVKKFSRRDTDSKLVQKSVQWRIDYPTKKNKQEKTELVGLYSLAESLLLRGSTPLCFQEVEKKLGTKFLKTLSLSTLLARPTSPHEPWETDSQPEKDLIDKLLKWNREKELGWTFQSQVYLASISKGSIPEKKERCDLLATHAETKPVVIEVDGSQHKEPVQETKDKDRDTTLKDEGIITFRIPADDLDGAVYDKLLLFLEEKSSQPQSDEGLLPRLKPKYKKIFGPSFEPKDWNLDRMEKQFRKNLTNWRTPEVEYKKIFYPNLQDREDWDLGQMEENVRKLAVKGKISDAKSEEYLAKLAECREVKEKFRDKKTEGKEYLAKLAECREVKEKMGGEAEVGEGPRHQRVPNELRWYRVIHQLQVSLLHALITGNIPTVGTPRILVKLPEVLSDDKKKKEYLELALDCLKDLLNNLAGVRDVEISDWNPVIRETEDFSKISDKDFSIAFGSNWDGPEHPSLYVVTDTVLPDGALYTRNSGRSKSFKKPKDVSEASAEWFLNYVFRKPSFREGQWQIIERALKGKSSILLLPTGAGKSIAFQLATLLRPGCGIVVTPHQATHGRSGNELGSAFWNRLCGTYFQ